MGQLLQVKRSGNPRLRVLVTRRPDPLSAGRVLTFAVTAPEADAPLFVQTFRAGPDGWGTIAVEGLWLEKLSPGPYHWTLSAAAAGGRCVRIDDGPFTLEEERHVRH